MKKRDLKFECISQRCALESIYEQLKDKYDLNLTENGGIPVLTGKSALGEFQLFAETDEFYFYVKFPPRKQSFWRTIFMGNNTHWHPESQCEALKSVVDFMEGTIKL